MKTSFRIGDGGPVAQELPRVAVVADFGASTEARHATLREAEDLQRWLSSCAPQLRLQVDDQLGGPPLDFVLRFEKIKDFSPLAIAESAPRTKALVALRRGIDAVAADDRDGRRRLADEHAELLALPALARCRAALLESSAEGAGAEARAGSASDGGGSGGSPDDNPAVGRLLEMVDMPSQTERARSAIGGVIGAVSRGGKRSAGGSPGLTAAAAAASEQLSRQLDRILHDPALQRLEAAWRGLKLVVDHCAFRGGVALEVVHLPRERLRDGLEGELERIARRSEQPLGLAVVAHPVDHPDGAELLQVLAEAGESHQTVIAASAGPGFFGLSSGSEADRSAFPATLFEEPQYAKWSSLRTKDCARWLALTTNRFLLRPLYTPEKPRQLGYEERADSDRERLWGDAVWALGALACRSLGEVGWPTEIIGRRHGRIEDRPVRRWRSGDEGDPSALLTPLEALIPSGRISDLAEQGVIALSGRPDHDAIFVMHAPTVYRSGSERGRLPYQLFVAVVAQELEAFRRSVEGGASGGSLPDDPQQLGDVLRKELERVLGNSGPGSFVDLQLEPHPDRLHVSLDLRTGRRVLGGARLELHFDVELAS